MRIVERLLQLSRGLTKSSQIVPISFSLPHSLQKFVAGSAYASCGCLRRRRGVTRLECGKNGPVFFDPCPHSIWNGGQAPTKGFQQTGISLKHFDGFCVGIGTKDKITISGGTILSTLH
jgi:hypothetical protein